VRTIASDLRGSRELAWRLIVRDIQTRYRQSALGLVWTLVPPIVTAIIFIFLNRQKILNVSSGEIPYPVFALVGAITWQVFVESTTTPLRVVRQNLAIVSKVAVPIEAFVMASMGQVAFTTLIQYSVVLVILAVAGIPFSLGFVAALGTLALLLVLGTTLGLLLVPLGALYTDIERGMETALRFWFFVTPVVYPTPQSGVLSWIFAINPVSPFITVTRGLLTGSAVEGVGSLALVSGLALVGLGFATILYRLSVPVFLERSTA